MAKKKKTWLLLWTFTVIKPGLIFIREMFQGDPMLTKIKHGFIIVK